MKSQRGVTLVSLTVYVIVDSLSFISTFIPTLAGKKPRGATVTLLFDGVMILQSCFVRFCTRSTSLVPGFNTTRPVTMSPLPVRSMLLFIRGMELFPVSNHIATECAPLQW